MTNSFSRDVIMGDFDDLTFDVGGEGSNMEEGVRNPDVEGGVISAASGDC